MKLEEMEVEPCELEVDNAGKTSLNAYNEGNEPKFLEQEVMEMDELTKERRFTGAFPYGLRAKPGSPRESVKQYDEVSTICTIELRWQAGDSLRAIARWLDGMGVTNRKGKPWHPTQIKRILIRSGLL